MDPTATLNPTRAVDGAEYSRDFSWHRFVPWDDSCYIPCAKEGRQRNVAVRKDVKSKSKVDMLTSNFFASMDREVGASKRGTEPKKAPVRAEHARVSVAVVPAAVVAEEDLPDYED